jgi:hypothetical protein
MKQFIMEPIMSDAQAFSFKDYSLSPLDLIDDRNVEDDEPEVDGRWIYYCELSATLDTEDLMVTVGEAFSNSDLLRSLVEEAKAQPFRPDERKRLHISDAIRLGEEVIRLIASAQDDQVNLRMAVEVPRD